MKNLITYPKTAYTGKKSNDKKQNCLPTRTTRTIKESNDKNGIAYPEMSRSKWANPGDTEQVSEARQSCVVSPHHDTVYHTNGKRQ